MVCVKAIFFILIVFLNLCHFSMSLHSSLCPALVAAHTAEEPHALLPEPG